MRRSVQRKSNPALTFLAKQSLCDGPLDRCSVKPSRLRNAERSREMRLYGAGGGGGEGGVPFFSMRSSGSGWEPSRDPRLGAHRKAVPGEGEWERERERKGELHRAHPEPAQHGTARPASFFLSFLFSSFFFFWRGGGWDFNSISELKKEKERKQGRKKARKEERKQARKQARKKKAF